jgi:hypothetical protein
VELAARLRRILKYSWIVPGIASLFVIGNLFLRRQENRSNEQRARQQALEKQRAEDQRVVEMLGGNRFEILQFYATPGIISRGETVQLCYGVSNAKSVRLEPQTNAVWPSFGRCVEVSPQKDTTYTLTIEDGAGRSKFATVRVQVR